MGPVVAGLAGVVIARRGRKTAEEACTRFEEPEVSDVVFVVLTVALFAVLALALRGVEKL